VATTTPYPGAPEAPNGSSPNIHRIFHALGDPTRRALVERLSEAPVSVSQLAEPFSISLAAVMQHLQILEECALVRTEKVGRVRTCRIEPKGFSVMEQWIKDRRTAWERRFDRLSQFLAETADQPDE
jgi:DNA-binding transcriptional ArsR family regulator